MDSMKFWLELGEEVAVGNRKLRLMPLPLSRLRRLADSLDETVQNKIKQIAKAGETPDLWGFIASLLRSVDAVGACHSLFSSPIDPDTGKPVNPDLTREFFEEYLDTPTLRRIVRAFIKVNELEETVKNLSDLPGMQKILEALVTTFGLASLKSLQQSMDSVPSRSGDSPSPRSISTLPEERDDSPPETSRERRVQ